MGVVQLSERQRNFGYVLLALATSVLFTAASWPWPWNSIALLVGLTFLLLATFGLYRSNSIEGLAGYISAAWIGTNGVALALLAVTSSPLFQEATVVLRGFYVLVGIGLVGLAFLYARAAKRKDSSAGSDDTE